MPPLVRRQPLIERIKAKLNPWDFLIWLSEELNDLEDLHKTWGTTIGLAANLVFMIARANSEPGRSRGDDVFGDFDQRRGSGWLAWIVSLVHVLSQNSINSNTSVPLSPTFSPSSPSSMPFTPLRESVTTDYSRPQSMHPPPHRQRSASK